MRSGGLIFGRSPERTRRALAAVGAERTLTRRLGVLSGGELQRVLIALALAVDPDVLVLDEPSSSIDVGGEKQVYDLIRTISRERRHTVLFVSHDLDAVRAFASQAVSINRTVTYAGQPTGLPGQGSVGHHHG